MALREIIMQGWSKRRSDCHVSLHAISNYRDEMIIANGLILEGTHIVIPIVAMYLMFCANSTLCRPGNREMEV